MSEHKAWKVGSHKGSTNVFQGKGNEMRLVAECGTHEEAHLIAAAPDLLEALESVQQFMIPGMNWTDGTGEKLKEMTRAAIAKAKGKDQ